MAIWLITHGFGHEKHEFNMIKHLDWWQTEALNKIVLVFLYEALYVHDELSGRGQLGLGERRVGGDG